VWLVAELIVANYCEGCLFLNQERCVEHGRERGGSPKLEGLTEQIFEKALGRV
jgi:hypothetical protein